MKPVSLKNQILLSFFAVIMVLALFIALLGYYVIKKDVIGQAQQRVEKDLKVARSVYQSEIERIGESLRIIALQKDITSLSLQTGLDYIGVVFPEDIETSPSEIVRRAFAEVKPLGGTRIVSPAELENMPQGVRDRTRIEIKFTQRARPTDLKVLNTAMVKEFALPILDAQGGVRRVLYGGRVINQDYSFVDRIRGLVFSNEMYNGKPLGTVTIFQGDVRVATNVLNENGKRAVGTRVSEEVYEQVVEKGKTWHDRAFVVTDWYKTAYEPIRSLDGEVIGILYVGILEAPFSALARNIIFLFMGIVGVAVVLAAVFSVILAAGISRPITEMRSVTHKLSRGDFDQDYRLRSNVLEFNDLADAFGNMAQKLSEREKSLKISNEKLVQSNKNYVDLIRFVAHELNGILGSAIMNTYSVRDGFLGMINFKQRKAIDSVARNLDYLAATVKKFLSLGRIERGELPVNKSHINLRRDVFDVSVDSLSTVAARKHMTIVNEIDPGLDLEADPDLLRVVANNLISNAVKYGFAQGKILLSSVQVNGKVQVEVYNDGDPITEEQKNKLFKKFSRLDTPGTKREKGNGLGLYITRNIVESHGGRIWVQPKDKGNSFIFDLERGPDSANTHGNYQEETSRSGQPSHR